MTPKPNQIERRFTVAGLEVRGGELREDDKAPEPLTVRGHAAVFNKESEPIAGVFREVVAPGAFTRALKEKQDVRALFNHDHSRVLARTKSGTLARRPSISRPLRPSWRPCLRNRPSQRRERG